MEAAGDNGCLRSLREEFRTKKFGLGHEHPSLFVKPQCFKPSIYIFWVVFWALFYFTILMLDVYYNRGAGVRWFAPLTNLSYLVQAVGVLIDCIVTMHVHYRRKDIIEGVASDAPWYIRVLWVMFNVSITTSFLVTLLYYTLLSPGFKAVSVKKHLLNSVYTVLLLSFTAKPVRILHVYQPMIYAISYVIFSAIFQKTGNGPLYGAGGPLDWNNPGTTFVTVFVAVFVGVPVVHSCCFAIYKLRMFIWRKCSVKTEPVTCENELTRL